MEKTRWQDFLASRLRSQISVEHAEKAQVWGLVVLALMSFAFAFSVVSTPENHVSFLGTKVIFLFLSHALLLLGAYLPSKLQKGEKTLNRFLGIRDFTSLTFISLAAGFCSLILLTVAFQVAAGPKDASTMVSSFFSLVAWTNTFLYGVYLAGFVFYLIGFVTAPGALIKWAEKSAKTTYAFIGLHCALLALWFMAYGETGSAIGSAAFFNEMRLAVSFWTGILASLLFIGKLLGNHASKRIAFVELEVISGKLERNEDILSRFKDTFVSRRLTAWMNRLSHLAATKAHEIAQYTHEAMSFVGGNKPTELDLRQVEDRYRKADHCFKKLEKEDQRFLLSVSLFDLNEVEREKIEALKDLFSRELRHAKLELASVRKRIDDTLVSLKNSESSVSVTPVPVEKIPVSR